MYKLNKKNSSISKIIKSITYWSKRKIILILTAFMVGISNGMYQEDEMINDNQYKIEQEHKENNDDLFE